MVGDVLEVDSGVLQVGDKVAACSEARVEVSVHSEAGIKAVACSEAGDEAAVCSRAGIMDIRLWWWHDSV
jgi:hypothetical protein